MVIPLSDLKFFYSGGTNKNNAQGDQGGTKSTVQITDQDLTTTPFALGTIFKDLTRNQRLNGIEKYVAVYLQNTHATETATNIKVFKTAKTPAADQILLWYSGNLPNEQEEFLTGSESVIYNCPFILDSESDVGGAIQRSGIMVDSEESDVFNQVISSWEIRLHTHGNPTGNLTVGIWHKSDGAGSDIVTADETIDVSTIGGVPSEDFTFHFTGNTYKMQLEDIIGVKYDNGDDNDYVALVRTSDRENFEHQVDLRGNLWFDNHNRDVSGRILTSAASGDLRKPTGSVFEDPGSLDDAIDLPDLAPGEWIGLWLNLDAPANTGPFEANAFELGIVYDSPD